MGSLVGPAPEDVSAGSDDAAGSELGSEEVVVLEDVSLVLGLVVGAEVVGDGGWVAGDVVLGVTGATGCCVVGVTGLVGVTGVMGVTGAGVEPDGVTLLAVVVVVGAARPVPPSSVPPHPAAHASAGRTTTDTR